MKEVDLVISPGWIVPIEPDNTVLEEHSIIINNGQIVDIIPTVKITAKYSPTKVCNLPGEVVMPGLVNSHTHNPMALLRGIANDLPLLEWLNDYIWPAEKAWLGEEFILDGMLLAMAEMIRGGTTCFNDHYFFPELIAAVTADVGMRANVAGAILEFPTAWAETPKTSLEKSTAFIEQYKQHPLINPSLGPHAPYTVNNDILAKIREIANEHSVTIQMHVHESDETVKSSTKKHGKRPLQHLYELGLLSDKFQCVHMTQINATDLEILQKTGAHVIHCPESNCKLASGYYPPKMFLENNINVAFGTDSPVSNNNLDMFGEMQTATLLAKAMTGDPTALPASQTLKCATLNGAKALGLEKTIGTLEVGKAADIIAVDMQHFATTPVYDPIAQIVYAAHSDQVSNVWVAGKQLLSNKRLTTIDSENVFAIAQKWQGRIKHT